MPEAGAALRLGLRQHLQASPSVGQQPIAGNFLRMSDWATSTGDRGVALLVLAKRRKDPAMAKTAVERIEIAYAVTLDAGDSASADKYTSDWASAKPSLLSLPAADPFKIF
jgi:hypothetical protein